MSVYLTELEHSDMGVLRYPSVLQTLHWAIAILVAAQFALILVVKQLKSLEFGQSVIAIHQQCGTLLLMMILVRLAVAIRLRAPSSNLPRWQVFSARAVHGAIFAALAAQPVLGLLVAWSRGSTVTMLGLVDLPALIELSTEQGVALEVWHQWLAYCLLALLMVHLGAVAFNLIVRRTSVLERMLEPPAAQRDTRGARLRRLCLCLALLVSMVTGVGIYAMNQYAAFETLSTRFDSIELTLLDEMRSAQLAVVAAEKVPGAKRTLQNLEDEKETLALVSGFAARLSDADARAAVIAAAASLRRADEPRSKSKAASNASAELQDAIDSQNMILFEGRLRVSETAAAGRDMIMLSLAPTIMLGLVLAFLMARSILVSVMLDL